MLTPGVKKGEQNATSFLLTTGKQNPGRIAAAARGGRSVRSRGRAAAAGAADDDDDGSQLPSAKSRGRGRGRGAAGRASQAEASIKDASEKAPYRGTGRSRGQARKSSGSDRGRGAAVSTSAETQEVAPPGVATDNANRSQFGDGRLDVDGALAFGSDAVQASAPDDALDLPDIEEF